MLNIKTPAIAPSILTADLSELRAAVEQVENYEAGVMHLDVMDGHFVPNLTIGVPVVAAVRKVTKLPIDVHLMVENPEKFIGLFAAAGADMISVHAEATPHLHRALEMIHDEGAMAGVALNPATPLSVVKEVITVCDYVLIMSVNPGFGGQSFIPSSLNKLRRMREMRDAYSSDVVIEVDGGINVDTIGNAVDAGAELIVAGSAVFHPDYPVSQTLPRLRIAAES